MALRLPHSWAASTKFIVRWLLRGLEPLSLSSHFGELNNRHAESIDNPHTLGDTHCLKRCVHGLTSCLSCYATSEGSWVTFTEQVWFVSQTFTFCLFEHVLFEITTTRRSTFLTSVGHYPPEYRGNKNHYMFILYTAEYVGLQVFIKYIVCCKLICNQMQFT